MNSKSYKITELTVSRHNVRNAITPPAEVVQALADNIIAISREGRLIHPITVQDVAGIGEVVAGKTRMLALQLLVEDGRLPEDATTDCSVVASDAEAVLVSQSENVQRTSMHPVAEFAGFQRLIDEGHSIEAIALAFGQTIRYVEGRLRLAKVAPALLEGFQKNNSPDLEQIMALALADDHARQLAVWDSRKGDHWRSKPARLREAMAGDGTIDASTDRRIKLVSVAEYEAAGGMVQASLLSDHTFLLNPEIFDRLVLEKLNEIAAGVQSEGWSWVEVYPGDAHDAMSRLGTTQPQVREPNEEEAAKLGELDAACDKAREDYDDAEGGSEEEARLEVIFNDADAELDAYKETFKEFTSEQKSFAGAAVFVDYDGHLGVRRGLVRREDRRALDEAARQGRVAAGVTGGRTTGDAGRPADSMSAALKDDLHGLRIIAVQNSVAKNPRIAKVMLALWAVKELVNTFGSSAVPLEIVVSGHGGLRSRLNCLGQVVRDQHAAQAEAFEGVAAGLPEGEEALWDALFEMTDEQLDGYIAHAVATAINPHAIHEGVTARLLDALGFDMAEHFTANSETFTARVPKPMVVAALAEVGKADDAAALLTMKKGPLAEAATARLAGTGWVPEIIRTPKREAEAVQKQSAAKPGKNAKPGKAAAPAKGK